VIEHGEGFFFPNVTISHELLMTLHFAALNQKSSADNHRHNSPAIGVRDTRNNAYCHRLTRRRRLSDAYNACPTDFLP
jgi:hypothetical protein